MTRTEIRYIVCKEIPNSDNEMKDVISCTTFEEAEKFLDWPEDLYGRIEKVRETFIPSRGGGYWEKELLEVVKEN